ncbi:hypothetical protein EON79_13970 [bacterium]|nr:MAG: hypothetical protein EON79_13970 [bacterium]
MFSVFKRTLSSATMLSGLLFLAGCGGGDGGSVTPVTPQTNVTFGLTWGARSRAIAGPSSALSVRVVLSGALQNGGDLVLPINRQADPAGYTQQVTAPQSSKVGTFPMSVAFYSGADGTGDIVASAETSVTILNDGTGIGNVTTENRVQTVQVVSPGAFVGTETRQLQFLAKDDNDAIIALSPGSATWTLVEGSDHLSLTADGIATGKTSGYATVRVSVDGATSAPLRLEVDNDPDGAPTTLNFDDLPSVSHFAGTEITDEAKLSDRYLNTLGIVFSSTPGYVSVTNLPQGDAPSSPNGISGATADGRVAHGQADPIVISFFDPKNPTEKAVVKSFSCAKDNDGIASQNIVATAYDVNGEVIAVSTTPDTLGAIVSVSSTVPAIHRIVLIGSVGDHNGISFDDIAFTPVVPVR